MAFAEQFYADQSTVPLTGSFVFFNFGHNSQVFTLSNDDFSGSNVVIFSLDVINVGGKLIANTEITWDGTKTNGLWLSAVGNPQYRLMSTYQRA